MTKQLAKTTGYESYSLEERLMLIVRMELDIRDESRNADGSGLRAEIARSTVRTLSAQILKIRKTK